MDDQSMDGFINFLKPPGITSHQCVAMFRKMLGIKKIGHAGTLDPGAAGVLPICIGKGTKAAAYLLESKKIYRAEMCLGITTESQDAYGNITGMRPPGNIRQEQLTDVFQSFEGKITQVPPMFSAIKRKGKPLYKLARRGEVVPRKPREAVIYSLEIIKVDLPRILFQVECSKGTYIRTLAADIGEQLGTGAYLSFLLRVQSGPFGIEESHTKEEVDNKLQEENLKECILPLDHAFGDFPQVILQEKAVRPFVNGAALSPAGLKNYIISDKMVRVYSPCGLFLALGKWQEKKGERVLAPEKIFRQAL